MFAYIPAGDEVGKFLRRILINISPFRLVKFLQQAVVNPHRQFHIPFPNLISGQKLIRIDKFRHQLRRQRLRGQPASHLKRVFRLVLRAFYNRKLILNLVIHRQIERQLLHLFQLSIHPLREEIQFLQGLMVKLTVIDT